MLRPDCSSDHNATRPKAGCPAAPECVFNTWAVEGIHAYLPCQFVIVALIFCGHKKLA